MRNTFVDTVIEASASRKEFLFLSGDAGLGVFDELCRRHPSSFLNLGVAEQNMASFGAGLALAGCRTYLYNIIPFLLYRCYEQVRNDICYQRLPVVLIGIGSGVTYAPAGMTHYAVEDLGIAATLPNLTVISPCDIHEARAAAEYSINIPGPLYVRISKRGGKLFHDRKVVDITVPHERRGGDDCAIVFHGSVAEEAIGAAGILEKEGIHVSLVSVPMLQPLDAESLFGMLRKKRLVMVVEEHFENTGLGSLVSALSAKWRPSWRLAVRGIPYGFLHEVTDTAGMRRRFGLDAAHMAADIIRMLDEQ